MESQSPVGVSTLPAPRSISAYWKNWWNGLSPLAKWLPAASAFAIWAGLTALGGFKTDHRNIVIALLVLGYAGPHARKLLRFLTPLISTGVVYDTQRYYADAIRGRIRVEEPYLFDKTFFGIHVGDKILTPNEFWQLNTNAFLDVITGFAYMVFIGVYTLIAGYFVFWLARKGTKKLSAARISVYAPYVMWAFFWLNVIGYTTYYWYPAAPPWYVSLYGLGPAQLDVPANPAGCARFDQIMGTHFFTGFYGRAADVFGAIPSLHVAYPLLTVLFAFQFGAVRTFSVFFYLLMCFSAVYLNHHYVLDILWGSTYAVIIFLVFRAWLRKRDPGLNAKGV